MKILAISILICFSALQTSAQYYKNIQGQPFSDEVLSSVLYDTSGKETNLKSVLEGLKGKVVLLDFWASWCKTCMREMPYSKKLQKRYEGKEISYLFLSTDTDFKQWVRGLARINIKGHHYRIDVKSKKAIQNYLKIRGIPYYVILDKEGNIYDPKAKWPHTEKLQKSLDLLLKVDL